MVIIRRLLWLVTVMALLGMAFSACGHPPTLSTSCIPAGSGTINPSSGTYDKGVEVDITASPATGYRFDHWEGAASGTSSTVTLVMDGNRNPKAYFTKTYILSTSCTPARSGTISPSSGTYDEGTEVTLIATPAQYYKFDGWGGDASGSSTHITIIMNSNKTIVASFSKVTYSIQFQVDPVGSGTIQPNSGAYEAGTQINIVATPSNGYRFDHWGGLVPVTSNTSMVFVDANKTVTAYFVRVYALSVSSNPLGSCSLAPSGGSYDSGTTVALTAKPVFPYAFQQWNGTDNDRVNPTSVTMYNDKSVIAYFKKLSAGAPHTESGTYLGWEIRIPIGLSEGQWVQGGMVAERNKPIRILDPNFTLVQDLGYTTLANFTFQAQTSGTYYVEIAGSLVIAGEGYTVTYTIYS